MLKLLFAKFIVINTFYILLNLYGFFFLQENEINLIDYDHITPTCVQNPVSAKVKRKKVIFFLSIIIKIINFSIIDVLIRYNMCVKCHSY